VPQTQHKPRPRTTAGYTETARDEPALRREASACCPASCSRAALRCNKPPGPPVPACAHIGRPCASNGNVTASAAHASERTPTSSWPVHNTSRPSTQTARRPAARSPSPSRGRWAARATRKHSTMMADPATLVMLACARARRRGGDGTGWQSPSSWPCLLPRSRWPSSDSTTDGPTGEQQLPSLGRTDQPKRISLCCIGWIDCPCKSYRCDEGRRGKVWAARLPNFAKTGFLLRTTRQKTDGPARSCSSSAAYPAARERRRVVAREGGRWASGAVTGAVGVGAGARNCQIETCPGSGQMSQLVDILWLSGQCTHD
jgi:hypothetical protein